MSNNKQSVKLYTEEQIKEAIKMSLHGALHGFGIGEIEDIIEVVASKFTPIELLSDEKINDYANNNIESILNKEFVQDEEALSLKELGFDEPCFKYIYIVGTGINVDPYLEVEPSKARNYNVDNLSISQPTFSQAFRWFREKYKIEPEILYYVMGYVCYIVDRNKILKTRLTPSNLFLTYEEAELACLRKLIEIVKQGGN